MITEDDQIAVETQEAERRRAAFLAAVPQRLLDKEDRIRATVEAENASARSKLRRVYKVMDEISTHREGHVACHQGCSACCRMNVTISSLEAELLASVTGRPRASISETLVHEEVEFIGKACPFLVDEKCSVYDNRPLACRKHASYYTTEKWCSPPYLNTVQAPLVRFGGLDEALAVVSARKTAPVFADIRDFFGTPK